MGKIIKKIMIIGVILCAIIVSSACADKLTKEEKAKLEILVVEAEKYYETKYDKDVDIDEYYYDTIDDLFGFKYYTDRAYFDMADGYTVSWSKGKGFADDAQAEDIKEAINILVKESYSGDGYETYFTGQIELHDDDFTAYFDGDIIKYILKQEEVSFYTSGEDDIIYATGDAEALIDDINKYFRAKGNNYEINVVEEGYLGQTVNYGDEGCIAQYDVYTDKPYIYRQHYIEIADGVYATAMEDGVILESGDIRLVERDISKEEMLNRIQAIYDEATEAYKHNGGYFPYDEQVTDINIEGKFMQVVMSDRLKKQIEAKDFGNTWIDVVIKLDDEVMDKGGFSYVKFDDVLEGGTSTKKIYKSWFKMDEEIKYYFIGNYDMIEID
ncbi:MAG: hypothetical protein IJV71_00115 [Lachnospiraceae bacterium]|nr:hypothetical protein [Lachnospiraceae bacterium]